MTDEAGREVVPKKNSDTQEHLSPVTGSRLPPYRCTITKRLGARMTSSFGLTLILSSVFRLGTPVARRSDGTRRHQSARGALMGALQTWRTPDRMAMLDGGMVGVSAALREWQTPQPGGQGTRSIHDSARSAAVFRRLRTSPSARRSMATPPRAGCKGLEAGRPRARNFVNPVPTPILGSTRGERSRSSKHSVPA